MWQAVVDLAKVCVEEKVAAGAAGWGVMEGQVVGRHPEGSGGSPLPPPLLSKPPLCCSCFAVGCMQQQQQPRCSSIGGVDCRAAKRYWTLSPHLPACYPPTTYLCSRSCFIKVKTKDNVLKEES